jgi:hypothetical protein
MANENDLFAPPSEEELAVAAAPAAEADIFAPPMAHELGDESQDSAIQNAIQAITGAGIGAGVGAAVPQLGGMAMEKGGKLGQKLVESQSPFNPEQLSNIHENIDQFKDIVPQDTMEKVGGQFEKINRIANEKEREAYANMTEPVTRQEFEQTVSAAAKPFTKEVPTDTPEFAALEQKFTPEINRPDPIKAQEAAQLEAFAEKQAQEKMAGVKAANMGMIPEEQLLENYRKTKQGLLKSKEGFAFVPDAAAAKTALDKEVADVAAAGAKGKQGAIEALQTPLAKRLPELKGRMFGSSEAVGDSDILKVLNQYKPGEKLVGEEPYQLVRKIRAMAYDRNDNLRISGDAAKAVQKQLRELVGEKNPEASELLGSMSNDIKQLESLEKSGYLKRDMDVSKNMDEFINFGEKQQQNVLKDIAPNLYSSKVQISDDVAQRLMDLKKVLPEPLFKEMELAALKQAMKSPKHQLNLSGFELAFAAARPALASLNIGKKALESAEGSLAAFRGAKAMQKAGQALKRGTKVGAMIGGVLGGPLGAMASELGQEALDVEPSGATPDMPDYWLEKGVANPEEQIQKARLSSFKEGLPNQGQPQTPGPYDKPEVQANREKMFQADKSPANKKNYVEKLDSTDDNDIQGLINSFQGMGDKVSSEYSNVLSKVLEAPAGQKDAILFGLNQQPAFREILRKAKGNV